LYNNIVVVAISVNSNARRHGVSDADVRHAVEHALFSDDIDPEPPMRRVFLGPDRAGNLLEVVTLTLNDVECWPSMR